jgi:hypothetical protein
MTSSVSNAFESEAQFSAFSSTEPFPRDLRFSTHLHGALGGDWHTPDIPKVKCLALTGRDNWLSHCQPYVKSPRPANAPRDHPNFQSAAPYQGKDVREECALITR